MKGSIRDCVPFLGLLVLVGVGVIVTLVMYHSISDQSGPWILRSVFCGVVLIVVVAYLAKLTLVLYRRFLRSGQSALPAPPHPSPPPK